MLEWNVADGYGALPARPQGTKVPSILVADDNANIQKMVALAFEDRGIKVVAVGNGEAAVRRIPEVQPDLVLADVFMPARNGYEVCEFVKKDERFAHVPVVLLVGAFDPLDEKEARRVGADGVLKKPFIPPDPLIAMVTSALEKNPKVVAELAAAKAAPVERLPEPDPAILAKPAPKPLPEFPEPSGDEAAVAYGYGARAGVFVGEPQEVSEEASDNAGAPEEGAADEAPESNDWRRSAMNFEVPQDVANQVPFSGAGDFDETMFPSERDVRPTKVRATDAVPEFLPPAIEQASAPTQAATDTSLHTLVPAPSEQPTTATPVAKQPGQTPGVASVAKVPGLVSVPKPEMSVSADHLVEKDEEALAPSGYSGAAPVSPEPEEESAAPPASQPADSTTLSKWIFEADAETPGPASAAAPETSDSADQATQEESFFADESADEVPVEPAPLAPETVHHVVPQPVSNMSAPAAPEFEPEPEDAEPPLAFKDPNLEEPAAVKVIPDGLLVEDAPEGPSRYGAGVEEIPPVYSYVASQKTSAPSAKPAAEEAPALESASNDFRLAADAASPSAAPVGDDAPAVDSETVDAVVQKVLAKLEPQLHEILAQGVLKPLVQNLLQNELVPKSK